MPGAQHIHLSRIGRHVSVGIVMLSYFGMAVAQTNMAIPLNTINPFASMEMPGYNEFQQSKQFNQKWFVSRYAAVSAGTIFYPGSNAFYVSAPIGWQLNRQLNRNLYAFGGVYAAPTFTSFNASFINSPFNKSYPGAMYPNNYFSVNPGVYMGLMYVNEAGTFSISGSVRYQAGSYPAYPVAPASNRRKR